MACQQDTALISRLKGGDLTAFDELYLKYYTLLCASAYFFLKNGQEAKDLVQSLFLDIWDRQLYIHFHDDIKGYLFLAVKNRCINHLKKQRVQDRTRRGYAAWQEEVGLEEMIFDEGVSDHYRRLQAALEEMPDQKKRAIQMVYIHGKRYQDAADTMRISINSLKTHLKTGLKLLRGEINSKIN
ncbi:MAG TPA: sigma-70 family RNA polymerase sigma factor [Puia sp.]|jgi:RNA polymerase sigma-70 factor (ECF subfamily)